MSYNNINTNHLESIKQPNLPKINFRKNFNIISHGILTPKNVFDPENQSFGKQCASTLNFNFDHSMPLKPTENYSQSSQIIKFTTDGYPSQHDTKILDITNLKAGNTKRLKENIRSIGLISRNLSSSTAIRE